MTKLENISVQKFYDGIKKLFKNGEELLEESELLASNGKYARAYFLSHLAIEEFSKISILFELLIEKKLKNDIEFAEFNFSFKDHISKLRISIDSEIAFMRMMKDELGYKWIDNLIESIEKEYSQIETKNELKKESLYVSIKNNEFQSPTDVFDKKSFDNIRQLTFMKQKIYKRLFNGIDEDSIEQMVKLIKEEK